MRPRDTLTERERHIINRITLGWTNEQIAFQDGNTVNSIRNYLVRIFDKVGVDTRLELAVWNIRKLMRDGRMCRSWRLSRGSR